MPDDPITPLRELAVQMHEMFREYIRAGFTRQEALTLIGEQIRGAAIGQGLAGTGQKDADL